MSHHAPMTSTRIIFRRVSRSGREARPGHGFEYKIVEGKGRSSSTAT